MRSTALSLSFSLFQTLGVSLGERPWFGENGSRVVVDRRGRCRRGARSNDTVPFTSRNSVFIEHETLGSHFFSFLLLFRRSIHRDDPRRRSTSSSFVHVPSTEQATTLVDSKRTFPVRSREILRLVSRKREPFLPSIVFYLFLYERNFVPLEAVLRVRGVKIVLLRIVLISHVRC